MFLRTDNVPNLPTARRWILVAGTGLEVGTPHPDILAAQAVGEQLAKYQYGLITGGWHGVDYVVAESFLKQLESDGRDPKDYFIQVIPEDWQPCHKGGLIVRTPHGAREWLEPQKYADAVILIGGRGGTYSSWLGALHDGIPRFPFGGLQGDSEKAFNETIWLWELIPVLGIKRIEFEALGQEIKSSYDAINVSKKLVEDLLPKSLNAVDALVRKELTGSKTVFISYSRQDLDWITRLRTLLRPAERQGLLSTWVDADIEYGKKWEPQLLSRINSSHSALLLVTDNYINSEYVREVELPAFKDKLKDANSNFSLFWSLLEPCNWKSVEILNDIQAIGDVKTAISESSTKSDEQCRLIEIVAKLTKTISPK